MGLAGLQGHCLRGSAGWRRNVRRKGLRGFLVLGVLLAVLQRVLQKVLQRVLPEVLPGVRQRVLRRVLPVALKTEVSSCRAITACLAARRIATWRATASSYKEAAAGNYLKRFIKQICRDAGIAPEHKLCWSHAVDFLLQHIPTTRTCLWEHSRLNQPP